MFKCCCEGSKGSKAGSYSWHQLLQREEKTGSTWMISFKRECRTFGQSFSPKDGSKTSRNIQEFTTMKSGWQMTWTFFSLFQLFLEVWFLCLFKQLSFLLTGKVFFFLFHRPQPNKWLSQRSGLTASKHYNTTLGHTFMQQYSPVIWSIRLKSDRNRYHWWPAMAPEPVPQHSIIYT